MVLIGLVIFVAFYLLSSAIKMHVNRQWWVRINKHRFKAIQSTSPRIAPNNTSLFRNCFKRCTLWRYMQLPWRNTLLMHLKLWSLLYYLIRFTGTNLLYAWVCGSHIRRSWGKLLVSDVIKCIWVSLNQFESPLWRSPCSPMEKLDDIVILMSCCVLCTCEILNSVVAVMEKTDICSVWKYTVFREMYIAYIAGLSYLHVSISNLFGVAGFELDILVWGLGFLKMWLWFQEMFKVVV